MRSTFRPDRPALITDAIRPVVQSSYLGSFVPAIGQVCYVTSLLDVNGRPLRKVGNGQPWSSLRFEPAELYRTVTPVTIDTAAETGAFAAFQVPEVLVTNGDWVSFWIDGFLRNGDTRSFTFRCRFGGTVIEEMLVGSPGDVTTGRSWNWEGSASRISATAMRGKLTGYSAGTTNLVAVGRGSSTGGGSFPGGSVPAGHTVASDFFSAARALEFTVQISSTGGTANTYYQALESRICLNMYARQ